MEQIGEMRSNIEVVVERKHQQASLVLFDYCELYMVKTLLKDKQNLIFLQPQLI